MAHDVRRFGGIFPYDERDSDRPAWGSVSPRPFAANFDETPSVQRRAWWWAISRRMARTLRSRAEAEAHFLASGFPVGPDGSGEVVPHAPELDAAADRLADQEGRPRITVAGLSD